MRLVLMILSLAAIGVGLVQIRRAETRACHRIQELQGQQVRLRRRLWDQQIRLGRITAPEEIRRRAEEMALWLTDRDGAGGLAEAGGRARR